MEILRCWLNLQHLEASIISSIFSFLPYIRQYWIFYRHATIKLIISNINDILNLKNRLYSQDMERSTCFTRPTGATQRWSDQECLQHWWVFNGGSNLWHWLNQQMTQRYPDSIRMSILSLIFQYTVSSFVSFFIF